MPKHARTLIIAVTAALTIAGPAHAASVKLLTMIAVPGEPIESCGGCILVFGEK